MRILLPTVRILQFGGAGPDGSDFELPAASSCGERVRRGIGEELARHEFAGYSRVGGTYLLAGHFVDALAARGLSRSGLRSAWQLDAQVVQAAV